MSDPVYSLITDLEGNGPCMAPYPKQGSLVAMLTPCPFADLDFIPGSSTTNYSDLSYGSGFIKATTSKSPADATISFRLKHNGGNRTIKISNSANSTFYSAHYFLWINGYTDYILHPLTLGDNILVPPYYRYQLRITIQAYQQTNIQEDFEEIWVKAEIF
ncbi:MAG: hypothetical protein PHO37_03980 [Kiritimatiellae bacterium]|nr:hypothetical protein [Kiritimatiellia bacterium]